MSRSLGRPGRHSASRQSVPAIRGSGDRWYLPPVGLIPPRRGDGSAPSGRPANPDPPCADRTFGGFGGFDRPPPCAGAATFRIVVDLADLDPRGTDAWRMFLAAGVLRDAMSLFEPRPVVVDTISGT